MTLLQKLIASLGGIAIASGFGSWTAIAATLPQPKPNQIAPQTGSSASEATPTTSDDLFNRGALRITTGDFNGAIVDFSRVIQLDPQHIEAYCNRGVAYALSGNGPRALADFDQALQIDPQHADAYDKRGTAYAQQGNFAAALTNFNQAIALDPNLLDAHYNRGIIYQLVSVMNFSPQPYGHV